MSGRKRKAEEQLTRITTFEEKVSSPYDAMIQIQRAGSALWIWCKKALTFEQSLYYPTEMAEEPTARRDHIGSYQSSRRKTSLKRQKICRAEAELPRSKSMINLSKKSCCGDLDLSRCQNEVEARKKVEDYWEPPPLLWSVKTSQLPHPTPSPSPSHSPPQLKLVPKSAGRRPITPVPGPESEQEPNFNSRMNRRRHSNPAASLRTPEASPQQKINIRERDSGPTDTQNAAGLARKSGSATCLKPEPGSELDKKLHWLFLEEPASKRLSLSTAKKISNAEVAQLRAEADQKARAIQAKNRRLTLNRVSPKQGLVQKLPPEWENRVHEAQSRTAEIVLTKSKGGTPLRPKDFHTLLGHQAWLNDEIINAYIEWIVVAANDAATEEANASGEQPSSVPKFIGHNSFFYQNLKNKGPASTERLMKRLRVPRGESLLNVDSIFIPICRSSHWTILVIRPTSKTIEYFDSMGGNPSEYFQNALLWVQHMLGAAFVPDDWTTPTTRCTRQTNFYDCGVFVCTNALCVAVGLETSCYKESDMIAQRRNIAAVLLNEGFKGDLAWRDRGGVCF